jgi:hypothetical protein
MSMKKAKNRPKSRIRARVEHVFAVVKRLWGFDKVRDQSPVRSSEFRPLTEPHHCSKKTMA